VRFRLLKRRLRPGGSLLGRGGLVTAALFVAILATAARPAGTAAAPVCRPVPGIDRLISSGAIILVGEIHGTEESPAFFTDLVCGALSSANSVTVALEIPREEGPRIDAFLGSPGVADDRRALLAGPFWQRDYQDGRSSRAYLTLLDALRRWREAGLPLRVVLLDNEERTPGRLRDSLMAERIEKAARAASRDLVLALTGNLHARLAVGTPWDERFEPMGYLLSKALPERRVTALDVATSGGSAWTCTGAEASSCQARSLRGRAADDARGVVVRDQVNESGYHGTYAVGPITASPPAVRPDP
jgi:hypothetical protein